MQNLFVNLQFQAFLCTSASAHQLNAGLPIYNFNLLGLSVDNRRKTLENQ